MDGPLEKFARGNDDEDSSSLELRQFRKCPSFTVRNRCFLFRPLLIVSLCVSYRVISCIRSFFSRSLLFLSASIVYSVFCLKLENGINT